MARKQRADFNWKLLVQIALFAWIGSTIWLFLPAITCSVSVISGSDIVGPVNEDAVNANIPGRAHETSAQRRSTASAGNGVVACFRSGSPLRPGAEVPLAAAGGSFIAFLLLSFIARRAHLASVRRSSSQQARVREKVGERRRESTGESKRPRRATGSALSLGDAGAPASTAGSIDLLDALDALEARSGPDPAGGAPAMGLDRAAPSSRGAAPAAPRPADRDFGARTAPEPARAEDEVPDDLDALFAMNEPTRDAGLGDPDDDRLSMDADGPADTTNRRSGSGPLDALEPAFEEDPFGSPLGAPASPDQGGGSIGGWDDWDDDEELTGLLANAEVPETPHDGGGAFFGEDDAPIEPAQVVDGDAGLREVRLVPYHVAGTDLRVGVRLSAPSSAALQRARIEVHLVDGSNDSWPLLDDARTLDRLHGAEALASAGRGAVVVPWSSLAARLGDRVESLDADARLRVSVELDGWEEVASTPIADHLSLQFVDESGVPVEPSLIEVRTRVGDPIRLGIDSDGRLDRVPLPPGRYYVQRLDRLPIVTAQGATSSRAAVETDGVAMLRGQLRPGSVRRLVIQTPEVVHVAPTGDDVVADGTRHAPFATLHAAIEAGARRAGGRPIELRLEPGTRAPADRPGLVGREWLSWWKGRAANPRMPWTEQTLEPLARGRALPPSDERIDGQLSVSGGAGVRIVNAGLVDLRARAATDRELLKRYNEERAALPMAVIAPPAVPIAPWRLAFDGCASVYLEAIHIIGASGESGVLVRNVRRVRIDRCWIDHFEGGRTASDAKWAVGRGLQVEKCGDSRDRVEIVGCDIGWNEAIRPSVPVRGAGIAIYGSAVRLDRCYIHDNAATKSPADVVVDRDSLVDTKIASHRAGNYVVDA